jgi:hypothetical protein
VGTARASETEGIRSQIVGGATPQVERGVKAVSVEALWKLAKALRVSMAELVQGV